MIALKLLLLGLDTTDISCGFYTVLLSWRTSDFEFYAAFDPLADKVHLEYMLLDMAVYRDL